MCDPIFQRQFKASAQDAIQEHIGSAHEGFELFEIIISLGNDDLAPGFDQPLDERIALFFALDQISARLPAFLRQKSQRNQCIAAIITRPDQTKHLHIVVALVIRQAQDFLGQAATGVFHHPRVGQAAGIGFLLNGAHFTNSNEFHGFPLLD